MSVVDITKTFSAAPRSSWDFLQTSGQGCYIPAYQRHYSWDAENVSRLFEDVLNGISQLLERNSVISFLGTIIAIKDTKLRTVHPLVKPDVAPSVMTIIDGQQRICTFMMLNIVFHSMLSEMKEKFSGKIDTEEFSWIYEQCLQVAAELEDAFILDMRTGEGENKFYPRVIRAYSDVWSRRPAQAKYVSPIAHLIWSYIKYIKGTGDKNGFALSVKDDAGRDNDGYKSVETVFSFIKREVRKIYTGKNNNYEFPHMVSIAQSTSFQTSVWGYELPKPVVKFITENSDHKLYDTFLDILRLIIFSKYISNRIALTIVTTESEDDAFDMFEALNTTGEPLTAFETFKPRIIDEEGIEHYETSPSRKFVDKIEEYLGSFHKAQDKQMATSDLLIPFALSENGEKLQKRLNIQRRYLREKFDELKSLDEKRDFVHSLSNISLFMREVWNDPSKSHIKAIHQINPDPAALVGLDMLRQLKHNIVIAPLSRFYDVALRAADGEEKKQAFNDFFKAVLATVAFSTLWRGAKGGTENIDNIYRDIMRNGLAGDNATIPPFAKRPGAIPGVVSLANYKRLLKNYLDEQGYLDTPDSWVRAASKCAIFKLSKVMARFIIFCASNDAVPDMDDLPLIKKGRSSVAPMLTLDNWIDEAFLTVEHIAPQSSDGTWDKKIYDEDAVHRLGNLTLLPQTENSIAGNRPWKHKKNLYALFASEDPTVFESIKTELGKEGLVLSKNSDEYLAHAKFLNICKSISCYSGDWTNDIIEKRSQRIAELAWPTLKKWLD